MQRCRRSKLLVGATLTVLTIGCASSGREQASRSGPSPSFGLNYVPQQTEPPTEPLVESAADSGNSTAVKNGSRKTGAKTPDSQAVVTANLDEPAGDPSGNKGNRLMNWMANREKEPAPRKPLPLTSSSPVASDDEQ